MEDIAPKLLEKVQVAFKKRFEESEIIAKLYEKIQASLAGYSEANEFASMVGEFLSQSYQTELSSDVLPDGKMYYNIAQRVIAPTMEYNYDLITDVTSQVQKSLNEAAGIGIKPVVPELNEDRIKGIVGRVSKEDVFDDIKWMLDGPIESFCMNIVDESVRVNAEFHADVGMQPKIVRKLAGGCCDWCRALAGTYSYSDDVPKDVYRRHQRCRCVVEYNPRDGKIQNVHTKKWREENAKDRIEARKKVGLPKEEKSFKEKLFEKGYINGNIERIGTNEVDMAYIRSAEYREKFNRISNNDKLNEALYKNAVILLDENKFSDTESTFVLNAQNGKTILKKQGEKNAIGVGLSDKDLRIIRNQKDIVGMHNHPTNLMPNGSDFVAAGYRGYDFGIVVTHDGRLFKYSVGKQPFQPQALDRRIDKYKGKEYNLSIEDAYIKALNEYRKEYGISWQEIE